jgi:hypothetical protein
MNKLLHFAATQKNVDSVAKGVGLAAAGLGVLLSIAILLTMHAR